MNIYIYVFLNNDNIFSDGISCIRDLDRIEFGTRGDDMTVFEEMQIFVHE